MDVIYNNFKLLQCTNGINLSADTINAILVTSAYTPNVSAHSYYSDISGEATGVGYTTSGVALSGKTVTISTSLSAAVFDAGDVTFTGSTITANGVVLCKMTNDPTTSPLIAYIGFIGGNQSSSLSNFQVAWNTNGILNLGQI